MKTTVFYIIGFADKVCNVTGLSLGILRYIAERENMHFCYLEFVNGGQPPQNRQKVDVTKFWIFFTCRMILSNV